jgi:hypothetical protein
VDAFENLSCRKLVENFKIGLPEPKLDSWGPKPIFNPTYDLSGFLGQEANEVNQHMS